MEGEDQGHGEPSHHKRPPPAPTAGLISPGDEPLPPSDVGQPDAKRRRTKVAGKKGPRMEEQPPAFRFEGGLRHVVPYVCDFSTMAKGRWFGREILEVSAYWPPKRARRGGSWPVCMCSPQIFQIEFGTYPREYYEEAIRTGTITVNGSRVHTTYIIRNGDKIIHKAHR
jgi:hypothetical protein